MLSLFAQGFGEKVQQIDRRVAQSFCLEALVQEPGAAGLHV